MDIKEIHYCAGSEECTPLCGPAVTWPITPDVEMLPARSIVLMRGVAWQKQALPKNGWTSTEATWLSNGVMCDLEDQVTVLWRPDGEA